VAAGLGQLVIAASTLVLPRVLGWKAELARLTPLTRAIFKTYAVYILGTNVALGALSVARPELLLDGGGLARWVAGYAACYWGGRLVVQFAYYDRGIVAQGLFFRLAEVGFVLLFALCTVTYGALAAGLVG
jgi:hypothetical protein